MITDGQRVNAATDNAGFMSRTDDTDTLGEVYLKNNNVASGGNIVNVQKELNSIDSFVGKAANLAKDVKPSYTNNQGFNSDDSLRTRADLLSSKFNNSTGHAHTGNAGDAPPINSSNISSVPLRGYMVQGTSLTGITGASVDVSSIMSSFAVSSGATVKGVVTNAPYNFCPLRDSNNDKFVNGTGDEIYARITYAASVWTLTFYYLSAAVETAYTFATSVDVKWYFQQLFNPIVDAPVYDPGLIIPSENATADVVDASATQRGVVSTGTQSFSGNKTFTGTIGAENLSGTNTGDVTLTSVGSAPDAKGATLSGQALTLQPADATHPGLVTATAQTIGGDKTFTGKIESSNLSGTNTGDVTLGSFGATPNSQGLSLTGQALNMQPASASQPGGVSTTTQTFGGDKSFAGNVDHKAKSIFEEFIDSVTTGAQATISNLSKTYHVLTNASLASISMISSPSDGIFFILKNATGADIIVKNLDGGTASNQILTGSGSDLTFKNNASIILIYDANASKWGVVGGSGSGSGSSSFVITAGENIAAGDVVCIYSTAQAMKANCYEYDKSKAIGICSIGASSGSLITVQIAGEYTNPAWSFFKLGKYAFTSTTNGVAVETINYNNSWFITPIGIIKNSTTIEVNCFQPVRPDMDLNNLITDGKAKYVTTDSWTQYQDFLTVLSVAVNTTTNVMGYNHSQGPNVLFGTKVRCTTDGTLPSPLAINTDYYVIPTGSWQFKLSTTPGGSEVDITTQGTGNHFFYLSNPIFGVSGTGLLAANNTSNPIAGYADYTVTHAAVMSLGRGLKKQFAVPPKLRAKVIQVSFFYKVLAGTFVAGNPNDTTANGDSDVTVHIIDNNGNSMGLSSKKLYSNSSTVVEKFTATFQSSISDTSYYMFLHSARTDANSFVLEISDFSIEESKYIYGSPVNDWQTYTPIMTGTISNPSIGNGTFIGKWRRVGDSAEIQIYAGAGTTTTTGSGEYRWSIPPGLSIYTSKNILMKTTVNCYDGVSQTKSYTGQTFDGLTIRIITDDSFSAVGQNFPSTNWFSSTHVITINITVPIVGWSSSVQMSNDADTRVVAATYSTATGQSIPNTTFTIVDFGTKVQDTHGAVTTGASWKFTATTPGTYEVSSSLTLNLGGGWNSGKTILLHVYKNGTYYRQLGQWLAQATYSGYVNVVGSPATVELLAGEYIDIRTYQDSGAGINLLTDGSKNWVSIKRLSGPSAIAATESISARYTTAAGQSIANDSNFYIVDFGTKVKDSTGAVTTGASWKFIAPVPGEYQVSCTMLYDSNAWAAGEYANARLYKNGSAYSNLYRFEAQAARTMFVQVPCQPIKLNLLAGEYIDVRISNNRSGGATTLINDSLFNWINISRIGSY